MQTSIYIRGIEEMNRRIDQKIKASTSKKTDLLLSQAKVVQKAIRDNTPVGPTGRLKRANYAAALPETATRSPVAFAGIRPRKAPHAHLVERGHGGPRPAPAHPFVGPAWELVRNQVRTAIVNGLKTIVEG